MTAPRRWMLCLLCLAALLGPAGQAGADAFFGCPDQPTGDDRRWQEAYAPRWRRVLAAERARPAITRAGEHLPEPDATHWRNLVKKAATVNEVGLLQLVNGFFNQWRPHKDSDTWSTPEHWASPAEFIAQRGGDCEDYAIAKYFALRLLGIPADRLRLMVVRMADKQRQHKQLHALLTVRGADGWFVLDNNARPPQAIAPYAFYQKRMTPLYSMNENNSWKHCPDPVRQDGDGESEEGRGKRGEKTGGRDPFEKGSPSPRPPSP